LTDQETPAKVETRGTKPYKQWYISEQHRRLREKRRTAAANKRADAAERENKALRLKVSLLELEANTNPGSLRNLRARMAIAQGVLDEYGSTSDLVSLTADATS
jgi:hypothetical protein